MCDFITPGMALAASLALAAGTAVAQDQSARAQAQSQAAYQKAQMRAHNDAAAQNAQAAIKEQNEQSTAENIAQMHNMEAAAREKQRNQVEFLQKRGAAVASSPFSAGVSYDALLADYGRALAVNNDVVQQQLDMQGVTAEINKHSYRDKAQARINSQQSYVPSAVSGPNTLATALGFAGNALDSYNSATNYGKNSLFQKDATKVKQ